MVAAVAVMAASVVSAAEVTLRMKGGDFAVTGELKGFDNTKYTIQSKSLGTMSLDASRFDCEGAGCPRVGAGGPAVAAAIVTAPPPTAGSGRVSVVGSNTIGGQLMPALVQAYGQSLGLKTARVAGGGADDIRYRLLDARGVEVGSVDINRPGSNAAFKALEKKTADIGMSSRPVKPDEAQRLAAVGLGDMRAPTHEHVLGLDGLVVLVAQDNPAVSLSLDAIAQIFAGQVTDWSQVGLPAGRIQVYAPSENNGNFDTFDSLVMRPRNLAIAADAKRFDNHAEQADAVAADKLGIGITSIAYQRNSKALNVEASCGLITRPSPFVMKTEEYPLSRRLFLYTPGTPTNPLARGLLDFALSPTAQLVVRQNDFIDQAPEMLDFQSQTTRIAYALNAAGADFDLNLMKQLIADFKPAQRLTTTFRFETASFTLDTKAIDDIGRLRTLLEQPDMKGKTVMVAGFADGVGRFDANLVLSQRRAAAVLSALQKAGTRPIQAQLVTRGFSQLAPVACNDTLEARSFNRRVEIWVR
jgi:phosphate transport system substrate-binding protein